MSEKRFQISPEENIKIVNGNVDLSRQKLTEIPEQYKDALIIGNFDVSFNYLKNLNNCPKYVLGSFHVNHNFLITLENGPIIVGTDYWCGANNLVTNYGMGIIGQNLHFYDNPFEMGPQSPCSEEYVREWQKEHIGTDWINNFNNKVLGISYSTSAGNDIRLRTSIAGDERNELIRHSFETAYNSFKTLPKDEQKRILELTRYFHFDLSDRIKKHEETLEEDSLEKRLQEIFNKTAPIQNKNDFPFGGKKTFNVTMANQSKIVPLLPNEKEFPEEVIVVNKINNLLKKIDSNKLQVFMNLYPELNTGKLVELIDVLNLQVGTFNEIKKHIKFFEKYGELMLGNWG
jgi:hypothetical protein